MKIIHYILALFLVTGCQQNQKPIPSEPAEHAFYVGTYTDGSSEGIYKYKLNADGTIQQKGLAAKTYNPSFMAWGPDKNYLVAVSETDRRGENSRIKSFAPAGDSLVFINGQPSGGDHPCFVAVNNEGFVLSANYHGGNVGLLMLDDDGALSDLLDVQEHTGAGIGPRQDAPHAHSAWFFPGRDEVIALDLGTNEMWLYKLDRSARKLLPMDPPKIAMAEGAGPRHLTFHPNGKWIYVLNELDCTVTFVERTGVNNYNTGSSVSTLPEDFKEQNTTADIHISADGKFLYASNRGHNSIAIFEVDEKNGALTARGHQSTLGSTPRNFALAPGDHFLLVANQNSNDIVSFKRDASTGRLSFVARTDAPSPVCILF